MEKLNHKQSQTAGPDKIFGKITVDEVREGLNPKKHTAQLRQVVTSVYAGVRNGNSLQDPLFTDEQFGTEPTSYEEQRIAFVDVPKGFTKLQVEAQLKKLPKARIYRILSLTPILTQEQERAIAVGLSKNPDGSPMTIEDYKAKFIVNPKGEAVLYNGHNQYRTTKFSQTVTEDVDLRAEQLIELSAGAMQMSESASVNSEA